MIFVGVEVMYVHFLRGIAKLVEAIHRAGGRKRIGGNEQGRGVDRAAKSNFVEQCGDSTAVWGFRRSYPGLDFG
ncbi:hypothetical protein D3C73_1436260 [compost metagenome]